MPVELDVTDWYERSRVAARAAAIRPSRLPRRATYYETMPALIDAMALTSQAGASRRREYGPWRFVPAFAVGPEQFHRAVAGRARQTGPGREAAGLDRTTRVTDRGKGGGPGLGAGGPHPRGPRRRISALRAVRWGRRSASSYAGGIPAAAFRHRQRAGRPRDRGGVPERPRPGGAVDLRMVGPVPAGSRDRLDADHVRGGSGADSHERVRGSASVRGFSDGASATALGFAAGHSSAPRHACSRTLDVWRRAEQRRLCALMTPYAHFPLRRASR